LPYEKYVDKNTGELITTYQAEEVQRIIPSPEKQIVVELNDPTKEYKVSYRSIHSPNLPGLPWQFTFVNHEYINELIQKADPPLSNREIALMFVLGCGHMNFDGVIVHEESGLYMTISDIADIMGWTTRTVLSALKQLEQNDVLRRFQIGRNTHVKMNPYIFYRGRSDEYYNQLEKFMNIKGVVYSIDEQQKSSNDAEFQ
jgi:DNA-binding MarR family transcriptional regulator